MRVLKTTVLALAVMLAGGGAAANAGSSSAEDENVYKRAFSAADEGKYDYARTIAKKTSDSLLERILTWLEYERPGSGASFEQITDFARANPNWPHLTTLARRAEEEITPNTPADVLRNWFEANPPLTAEGAMAWGRVLQNDGQPERAAVVLRHAWIDDSFGPIQEREFLAHFGSLLRNEDDVARLDRLLWDHQDEAATSEMRRVDEAHRRLARARMALEHESSSANAAVANVFEADRHDPGLVYEQVQYHRERNHEDQAIALLKDPAVDRGRPDLWWTERAILARYALDQGNPQQALDIASAHGALDGIPYAEAEWLAGWIALRFVHGAGTALPHFTGVYARAQTPLGQSRGAYWAGLAAEAVGDQTAAHHWFELSAQHPTAFYGQLAATRGGHDGAGPLPSDPLPTSEDISAFRTDELARAARMLGEGGQTDEMRAFLLRLVEINHSPGIRAQAAQLATSMGRVDIAISVAHNSERDGVPLIASGYPIPTVVGESSKPERALVLGLIRQESGFHRDAVSSAGARGLMQLMPATAARIAHAIKMAFKRKNTLDAALTHDASLNLKLGSAYLIDLLDQFNGSYILAVAAYNAGPSRVQKWVHEFGDPRTPGVDPVDWIERIPFTETRNYVQRVLEGVQVYRQRLGTTSFALSLESDLKR